MNFAKPPYTTRNPVISVVEMIDQEQLSIPGGKISDLIVARQPSL
mgnify:CR=1 FL=1